MPPTYLLLTHPLLEVSLKPHGGVGEKNVQVDQNEINPFHNRKRSCIKITHKRENQETNIVLSELYCFIRKSSRTIKLKTKK